MAFALFLLIIIHKLLRLILLKFCSWIIISDRKVDDNIIVRIWLHNAIPLHNLFWWMSFRPTFALVRCRAIAVNVIENAAVATVLLQIRTVAVAHVVMAAAHARWNKRGRLANGTFCWPWTRWCSCCGCGRRSWCGLAEGIARI